ncbi:hypothetical protein TNCV_4209171 [Trichonephila clavipes]|nr:hypothetical protein TNCV_4209171 [Trichonephila clavipes]
MKTKDKDFTSLGVLYKAANGSLGIHVTSVDGDYDWWKDIGLGSNPGENMVVCKCIVSLRHGGAINSHRAASPLARLVEGEERWEVADHPQSVCSPSKLGWNVEVQPVSDSGNFHSFPKEGHDNSGLV